MLVLVPEVIRDVALVLLRNTLVAPAALDVTILGEVMLRGLVHHDECLVERVDRRFHRGDRQLALGGQRAVEAEVELALNAMEEEGRMVQRCALAPVAASGSVARRAVDILPQSAIARVAEVQCKVVATDVLVTLTTRRDAELKVVDALL